MCPKLSGDYYRAKRRSLFLSPILFVINSSSRYRIIVPHAILHSTLTSLPSFINLDAKIDDVYFADEIM